MDEGKGEEVERLMGGGKKTGFIREGPHQRQGDLVNGKGAAGAAGMRYSRKT